MADIMQYQHACNRISSANAEPASSLFKNDANNVGALQRARLQRKLAEAAAILQKEQLDAAAKDLASETEEKEKVLRERDQLQTDFNTQLETLQAKDNELDGSKAKIKALMEDLDKEKQLVQSLKHEKETELARVTAEKNLVENLKRERETELARVTSEKNLVENLKREREAELASVNSEKQQLDDLRSQERDNANFELMRLHEEISDLKRKLHEKEGFLGGLFG